MGQYTVVNRNLSFRPFSGLLVIILASCSHMENDARKKPRTDNPVVQNAEETDAFAPKRRGFADYRPSSQVFTNSKGYQVQQIPSFGEIEENGDVIKDFNPIAPRTKTKFIDTHIKPLKIPDFLDYVFGEALLDIKFVTGPGVSKMTDVIQLRTNEEMSGVAFQQLTVDSLKDYGIRFLVENDGYKVVLDKELRAQTPIFIRSRANLRTPNALQPYLEFVSLNYVDANSMKALLDQAFLSRKGKITIKANPGGGNIALSGLWDEVDEAYTIIKQFDTPYFSGGEIIRYTPKYWNAGEFSKALLESLVIEGLQATDQPSLDRPIHINHIENTNGVFIFTKNNAAKERVIFWIDQIDQPVKGGDTENFHVYQVKNTNAEILANTVNQVLSGQQNSSSPPLTGNVPGAARQSSSTSRNTQLTVDLAGNRIVFVGTQSEYDNILSIFDKLDTLAPEVLIEVFIAEVTLTDEHNTGVEFFIDDLGDSNFRATAGTGGLGLGSSGLNIGFLSGNIGADINAFASNRDVKLLSKPTLVARSGSAAEIQIGQDIPVITAQRAANNQNGIGPIDILQSIEYRKVGNLLSIEPIVFSDNRIDLTIVQEVSSTVAISNSSISSPTISNRSISTQLSLEDGQTAILGGLIQDDFVRDEKGVPILKDLPIVGQLFSNNSNSVTQTDLVLLITAYVLRGQNDKDRHVRRLKENRVDRILNQDLTLPFIQLRESPYREDIGE